MMQAGVFVGAETLGVHFGNTVVVPPLRRVRFPANLDYFRFARDPGMIGSLIPYHLRPPVLPNSLISENSRVARFCVLESSSSNVPSLRFGESAPRNVRIC